MVPSLGVGILGTLDPAVDTAEKLEAALVPRMAWMASEPWYPKWMFQTLGVPYRGVQHGKDPWLRSQKGNRCDAA